MGEVGRPVQPAGVSDGVGQAGVRLVGHQCAAAEAWAEVLTLSPDADIPGMYEQFMCHWQYAEFATPGKTSWNLEPWRPEVSTDETLAGHCNPGGTEEPF